MSCFARWLLALLPAVLLSAPTVAQGPQFHLALDSGTVARLTWRGDGREQVRLLRRLEPTSESVWYCRTPSSGCGPGSTNPIRERATASLEQVEVHHGNHVLRGALWGAAFGALSGAFGAAMQGLSDTRVSTGRQVVVFAIPFAALTGFGALLGSTGHDWAMAP